MGFVLTRNPLIPVELLVLSPQAIAFIPILFLSSRTPGFLYWYTKYLDQYMVPLDSVMETVVEDTDSEDDRIYDKPDEIACEDRVEYRVKMLLNKLEVVLFLADSEPKMRLKADKNDEEVVFTRD